MKGKDSAKLGSRKVFFNQTLKDKATAGGVPHKSKLEAKSVLDPLQRGTEG